MNNFRASSTATRVGRHAPRVAVIGAGPAGLSAARALNRHGLRDVVVFEARARPGGRVLTARIGNIDRQSFADLAFNGPRTPYSDEHGKAQNVDLGASVMVGCGDDCQYVFRRMIADKVRAPIVAGGVGYESTEAAVWMDENGARISAKTISEMHRVYDACIRYIASIAHFDSEGLIDMQMAWNEAIEHFEHSYRPFSDLEKNILQKIVQRGYGYNAPLSELTISLAKHVIDSKREVHYHVGIPHDEEEDPPLDGEIVSLNPKSIQKDAEWFEKYLVSNIKPLVSVASRRGGMGDRIVVDGYTPSLIDKIKEGVNIRFCSPVKNVKVVDGSVEIRTDNGSVEMFDYVVCTAPLGVLQNKSSTSAIHFHPELSADKQAAINEMGAGVHNKVVLFYDKPFWTKNTPQINCLDMRFQFLNLHAYGKTGVILAHVFAESRFGYGYENKTDEQVVEEVQKCLYQMFCSTGKWVTRVPRTMNIVVKGKRYGPPKPESARKRSSKQPTSRSTSSTPPSKTTQTAKQITLGYELADNGSDAASKHKSEIHLANSPSQSNREHNFVFEEEIVLDGSYQSDPSCHEPEIESTSVKSSAFPDEESAVEMKESASFEIPTPKSYIVTRWDADPFSLGSYSYLPPGTDFSLIREFQIPEKMGTDRDVLYFAGEHVSSSGWQCVHGAYETGLIAARGILVQEGLVPVNTRFEDLDEYPPPIPKKNVSLDTMDEEDVKNLQQLCQEYEESPGHLYDVFDELMYRIESKEFENNNIGAEYTKPTSNDRKALWHSMQELSKQGNIEVRRFLKMRWQLARDEASTLRTPFAKKRKGERKAGIFGEKIENYNEVLEKMIDNGSSKSVLELSKTFATSVYHTVGAVMPWGEVVKHVQSKLCHSRIEIELGEPTMISDEVSSMNASRLEFPTIKTFNSWVKGDENTEWLPLETNQNSEPNSSRNRSGSNSPGVARNKAKKVHDNDDENEPTHDNVSGMLRYSPRENKRQKIETPSDSEEVLSEGNANDLDTSSVSARSLLLQRENELEGPWLENKQTSQAPNQRNGLG